MPREKERVRGRREREGEEEGRRERGGERRRKEGRGGERWGR